MRSRFWLIRGSRSWRIICILCTPFIVSYVLFEVLDLDGSNFHRPLKPVVKAIAIAETARDLERSNSLDPAPPWTNILFPFDKYSVEFNFLRYMKSVGFSPLDSARSHGYRVGLPRDSVADAAPYP